MHRLKLALVAALAALTGYCAATAPAFAQQAFCPPLPRQYHPKPTTNYQKFDLLAPDPRGVA